MEIKLTLQCLRHPAVIPASYQYELSCWIYRVLREADLIYAHFLHEKGYLDERKSFKMFCFSHLHIRDYEIIGDRIRVLSPEVELTLRFCVYNIVEDFIEGLFRKQRFCLGDRKSRACFEVKTIRAEALNLPDSTGEYLSTRVRMSTPLVISRKLPGQRLDEYLAPEDPDFGRLLIGNLLSKYRAFSQKSESECYSEAELSFCLLTDERMPRSKLITIKSGTPQETRVRGWLIDFEITAPRELIAIGMLAGWGRSNSQGFGFGRILSPRPASPTARRS